MFTAEEFSLKIAKAPFDDSRADIILRSSDSVNFRVFKIILSLASSVFADMFNIPPPASQKSSEELPVVTLSENSEALDLALRHCYPIQSPELVKLHDARILLEFARKYQVDLLSSTLKHFLTDNMERDPVGVYVLAGMYEYQNIAKDAARSTLKLPISRLQSPELQYATAEQHQLLIQYYVSCGAAASAVTLERHWFPSSDHLKLYSSSSSGCCMTQDFMPNPHDPISSKAVKWGPRHLWNYLHRSALLLAHHASPEAVTAENFVFKDLNCPPCTKNKRDMLEFSRIFAAEIKEAIERVPFPPK